MKKGDFIRVEAKNEGNPSKPSVHITPIITYQDVAVEDKEAPTKPSDLRVTDVKKTSVTVNWAEAFDNVDVAGYRVCIDGKLQNTDKLVEGTSYTVEGLQAGTTYKVEVAAVDTAGNESEKAEVSVTTESDVVVVDKSKLQAVYDKYSKYDVKDYTAESWKNFAQALENAKTVLNDGEATQDEVDKAFDALNIAQKVLIKIEPTTPEKPGKPQKPNKPDTDNPITGDQTNLGVYVSLLTMSGLLLAILGVLKKRKSLENR